MTDKQCPICKAEKFGPFVWECGTWYWLYGSLLKQSLACAFNSGYNQALDDINNVYKFDAYELKTEELQNSWQSGYDKAMLDNRK